MSLINTFCFFSLCLIVWFGYYYNALKEEEYLKKYEGENNKENWVLQYTIPPDMMFQ